MTARGLQFDRRFWVCQKTFGFLSCGTICVDYPTLKEHQEKRCRVMKAMKAAFK